MTDIIENWPELKEIERPARYLGGEMGAEPNRIPDRQGRLLKTALAFSDVYEIAHGHLGHKILYSLINQRPGLSAERVYAPWPDWEAALRRRNQPLTSLENRLPLAEFDLVGFSLQYELGYSNILAMLDLGRIPLKAAERDEKYPLIAAGGPGVSNPEPLADFFDLFFLGDAELSFVEDLEIIKQWRSEGAPKSELWPRLAGRPGLYIPSLFRPEYGPDGRFAGLEALRSGYERVVRAVVPRLETAHFPPCQITPLIKPVHDRVVVEIGRGCARGCRFCQAGYIYRPVRERRRETILDLAGRNLAATGQDEVSFLSLSAGDHTQIAPLVSEFMDQYASQTVALSLPSLRVKSLSGHLARQIRRVRKTGFTLAPEAGTQRLRDVINKDLTDDDLLAAAEEAFRLGWRTLKLYFMVGLPTETDEDLAGIAELTRRLKKLGRAQLNLGVAHFTPKAHTPFQWHPASREETISERLLKIRDLCRTPGLTPKWNAPGASWVESILARGDRRLGPVLERVFLAGARFEAWGDRFKPELWREALAAENLDEDVLLNPFRPGDPRPYGHLFAGVSDEFLHRELEKSQRGQTTADCRWAACQNCGACGPVSANYPTELSSGSSVDSGISPIAANDLAQPEPVPAPDSGLEEMPTEPERPAGTGRRPQPPDRRPADSFPEGTFLINFKKEGRAAYLGHLELVELFKRAFRRAGIELAQSQGFHPQPKISFLTALPLGVPSLDEYLRVVTARLRPAEELAGKLGDRLPQEVTLKGATLLPPGRKVQPWALVWLVETEYDVFYSSSPLRPKALLRYTDKKGAGREYNLEDFIEAAESDSPRRAILTIRPGLNGTPKPLAAAEALWGLEPGSLKGRLMKLETILHD